MEIMGISRKDFSNAWVQFEVKNLTFMENPSGRSAGFYRVAPRDIIRVISTPTGASTAKIDPKPTSSPDTVTSSTKPTTDISMESSLAKRKAAGIGISDDDTDFFAEALTEMNNMKDKFENSPLAKRMREFKHLKMKKEQNVQEQLKNKMTVFNLNESLFEAAQIPMIDFAGKKYTLSQLDSPEVF